MNDCAFVREISFFVHDDFEAAGDPSVFVKLVLEVVLHGLVNVVCCLFDVFYVPSATTVTDAHETLRIHFVSDDFSLLFKCAYETTHI